MRGFRSSRLWGKSKLLDFTSSACLLVWSVEHILKLHDDEIRRQEISFDCRRKDVSVGEHMRFNRDTLEWEMNYDPYDCGRNRCAGMCPVLGHELDKKRGMYFMI